ncbi:MAG: hypothetical protein ACD_65C00216G0007 [uncultured bacterium]|nr:MAG: hypothetical protein ACD_65C00216G0007 [uncultured bacterium]OGJ48577.1 MAG: hypothetical protein A2344_04730 [Candidatus Peregrinibacteria bacterium RIFOXYB12_FULL_41_12]OGJ48668.1 MAG: hypothetical protein A2244_03155 [Candidatus Peregrinibacteria bacterium RIFOXYA2_FULL_41_18]OGJ52458.1 MAG: hypothetical protein A2448_03575 [Candidatus Peregrinibacteria bacterium RIFOXYC2_FULL_41_22]OGJ55295.1 MAG: hypothetical protein A2336_01090 [Candidatus Peregrinibacteria bacterium RIFOXYB2_FULL
MPDESPKKPVSEIGVQDIRKTVRDAASANAPAQVATPESDLISDVDSFSSKMDNVLQDAGLSKKHVYFCLGGVVFLIVVFLIVIFGIKFFVGILNGRGDSSQDGDVEVVDVYVPVDVPEDQDSQNWVDPSLYGGILLGTDTGIQGKTGVPEGVDIGAVEQDPVSDFAYQIDFLGKVQNLLDLDVNAYLNDFTDRATAVDELISEMDTVYAEGEEIVSDLDYQVVELETIFNANTEEKSLYDEEFFAKLNEAEGNTAVTALDNFIEIGKEQVEVKANYKAKAKLMELIAGRLLYLEARITDIAYNREALVQGIQVVDIRGSDLNLIFEGELE